MNAENEPTKVETRALDFDTALATRPAADEPRLPVITGDAPTNPFGQLIGRYRLLERIGEGGCGVVYVAEQTEPVRRKVALKLIKFGMDTEQVVGRFEAERQALAMMDHPNIAKVLDAGATESGRPYFVMELVRGIKITDYSDQHRLSTRERVKLLVEVCQAIQHAHQKGIIHRDIKPSNVLVAQSDTGPSGVPKVIDFGIAKATGVRLTDSTVFTQLHQFIGTPAYMSPEQAEMSGLDIDTRSDIYSLGVVLYELLTGTTPFDSKELVQSGIDGIRAIIRERQPVRPSTRLAGFAPGELTATASCRSVEAPRLVQELKGDLDWIVMKCLEKDRSRRYETANGLAADLKRHLENEPVTARPPSAIYRFQKAWRRNRVAFSAATAVLLALISGLGISNWALYRAKTETLKAQQVSRFLKDMLDGVEPEVAVGRDVTLLREVLNKTAARISTDLKTQPEVAYELDATIGQTYNATGEYQRAEAILQQALTLAERLYGRSSSQVATALTALGKTLLQRGQFTHAEHLLNEATALWKQLHKENTLEASETMHQAGVVYTKQGRYQAAEPLLKQAIALRRQILGPDDINTLNSTLALGVLLYRQQRYTELGPLMTDLVASTQRGPGTNHPLSINALNLLASARQEEGDFARAEELYRQVIDLKRKVYGLDHPDTLAAMDNLALLYGFQGRFKEAEKLGRQVLDVWRTKLGPEHPDTFASMSNLAEYLRELHQYDEAEQLFQQAIRGYDHTLAPDHPYRLDAMTSLAQTLRLQSRHAEAEKLGRQVLEARRRSVAADDPSLADALSELSITLLAQGRSAEALPLASECLSIREKRIPDHWTCFSAKSLVGTCLLREGDSKHAEELLRSGYEGMLARKSKIPAYQRYQFLETIRSLVELYKTTQRPASAAEWQRTLDRESSNSN